jgi:hypothetical protein
MILNKSDDSVYSYLFADLIRKAFSLSQLNVMLFVRTFFAEIFMTISKFPYIVNSVK